MSTYTSVAPQSPRDYNNFGAPPDRSRYKQLVTDEHYLNQQPLMQSSRRAEREGTSASARYPLCDIDLVQFSCAIYIVNIDEGKLQCDIMRMGKMKEQIKFKYQTSEASARAGYQFEPTSGTLTMEPGHDSAVIEVPIICSDRWNPTTEFSVVLSDPEGCTLGLYLKVARVKVLDSSTFPLDKFKEQVKTAEGIETINKFELFQGFIYQMWCQDGIRWRTICTILLDQLGNVYVYLRLVLAIYMVDKIFNFKHDAKDLLVPDNRLASAWAVAGLILMPMLILYAAEMIKIRMDIKGRLQRDLARNLFRKFMNYNKLSREDVPTPDCVTALTQDAATVIHGYADLLRIMKLSGKVAISIFFTLEQNPSAWWACVLVPSVMGFWGAKRMDIFIRVSQQKGDCESGIIAFVNEVLMKLTLIADYAQRPQMNESFAEKSEELRNQQIPAHFVIYNNMFVPEVLGPALVALYTGVGAALVLNDSIGLGVYLATISVFGDICGAFEALFGRVMDVISTFIPLESITLLLNKTTDVPAVKAVNRQRRALTKEFRAELIHAQKANPPSEDEDFVPAADKLEIKLVGLDFGHPGAQQIFSDLNFSCKQGTINAIKADPGDGRRTLLELIAHKMFPDSGTLFIPSHLRILYVSADSVLLNLSVWQNLTFGNSKGNNPFRVERILKALRMGEILELCKYDLAARKKQADTADGKKGAVEEEEEEAKPPVGGNPLDKLRASQKANIHLARALIMNPEIMCLNRPFVNYPKVANSDGENIDQAGIVATILQETRDNRGYEMDPTTKMSRRPRTLFFTPDQPSEAAIADVVWLVPSNVGGECFMKPPHEAWPDSAGHTTGAQQYQSFAMPSSQYVTPSARYAMQGSQDMRPHLVNPNQGEWTERDFALYQHRQDNKRFCCG